MTDEQINIAIAEACGWTEVEERKHVSIDYDTPSVTTRRGIMGYHENHESLQFISNYCRDLNAMHEAEKVLTSLVDQLTYLHKLSPIKSEWTLATSTARQRAEAFLKTLNLWKE